MDYDPLLAKLIGYGTDRDQAIGRLTRALNEYFVGGIKTNISLFRRILSNPAAVACAAAGWPSEDIVKKLVTTQFPVIVVLGRTGYFGLLFSPKPLNVRSPTLIIRESPLNRPKKSTTLK